MPAQLNLTAHRNVPFIPTLSFYYTGGALPLTGATIAMHVRQYGGMPDPPNAASSELGFTDYADATDDQPTRRRLDVYPSITEATLADMPSGLNEPEIGEADRFVYDIVITYEDGVQDLLAEGNFYVKPGVTD
jgi:hypothetical protein